MLHRHSLCTTNTLVSHPYQPLILLKHFRENTWKELITSSSPAVKGEFITPNQCSKVLLTFIKECLSSHWDRNTHSFLPGIGLHSCSPHSSNCIRVRRCDLNKLECDTTLVTPTCTIYITENEDETLYFPNK